MINIEDQNQLFKIIADNLEEDIECIAFGGTAMMYYQYKNSTKDIDIIFNTNNERKIFIKAIAKLGYKEKNIGRSIYKKEKSENNNAPLMFLRNEEERFDLFSEKIFQTQINDNILNRAEQIRDYNGKKQFRIKVISPEDLVLLKAVTDRERDLEDIRIIVEKTDNFEWNTVINEANWQSNNGDGWAILDLEDKMSKLKDILFIKKKYFDKLYKNKKNNKRN